MHRQTAIFQWCLEAPPGRCWAALAGTRLAAFPRSAGAGEGPSFVPGAKVVLGPILSRMALVWVWKLNGVVGGGKLSRLEKLQIVYTTQSCFKKYQADENTMIISTQ